MDWQGQKRAEEVMQYMLMVMAAIAFVVGYFQVSFQLMVSVYAAGSVLTAIVTVPNWWFYNRQGLKWLDPDVAAPSINPVRKNNLAAATAATAAAAGGAGAKKKGSKTR